MGKKKYHKFVKKKKKNVKKMSAKYPELKKDRILQ